tara:strand:- start:714 stop:1355 length:642 start_codon:yes stop_codon:yes gene_type:complete
MKAGMKLTEELRQAHLSLHTDGNITDAEFDRLLDSAKKLMQTVTARKVFRFMPEVLEQGLPECHVASEMVEACVEHWLHHNPALRRRLDKCNGHFLVAFKIPTWWPNEQDRVEINVHETGTPDRNEGNQKFHVFLELSKEVRSEVVATSARQAAKAVVDTFVSSHEDVFVEENVKTNSISLISNMPETNGQPERVFRAKICNVGRAGEPVLFD